MNLSLGPEAQRLIEQKLSGGRFRTAEDVIVAALTAMSEREGIEALSPGELDAIFPGAAAKIAEGLRAADSGDLTDGEEFFEELDREDAQIGDAGRKTA